MTSTAINSHLKTVKEAASYLRCGVSTLNKLRVSGGGPMYVKMHGRVLYKIDDLDRYIAQHRSRSTAEEKHKAA
jgi:excisionase family DNA binding protein